MRPKKIQSPSVSLAVSKQFSHSWSSYALSHCRHLAAVAASNIWTGAHPSVSDTRPYLYSPPRVTACWRGMWRCTCVALHALPLTRERKRISWFCVSAGCEPSLRVIPCKTSFKDISSRVWSRSDSRARVNPMFACEVRTIDEPSLAIRLWIRAFDVSPL